MREALGNKTLVLYNEPGGRVLRAHRVRYTSPLGRVVELKLKLYFYLLNLSRILQAAITAALPFFSEKIGSSDAFTRYLALWGGIISQSRQLFCVLIHYFVFSGMISFLRVILQFFYRIFNVCQKFEKLKNFLFQSLKIKG